MSTSNANPRLVSLHVWTRVILTSHGIPFTGLLANTTGINSLITCSSNSNTTPPGIDYDFNLDDPVVLHLDTSGNLYDCDVEVLSTLKPDHS